MNDRTLDPRRHLEIDGANDVRDLGGYPTQDGRETCWRRFVRADDLCRLSPAGQAALLDYGVRTVIDLRRAREARIVATTGPYGAIRHPIYASMYLISIGMGLVFFAWLWFVVLIAFLPLWWLEARTEEREMRAAFGEAYTHYQARTPMFIPGLI